MSAGISLAELLAWNQESSRFWKNYLDANPHVLALPCDIGGTSNVREFVCHIWGVELRWGQRLAGLPVTPKESFPVGPLDALFDLHLQADAIFRSLMAAPEESWKQTHVLDLSWVTPEQRSMSRRKVALHALFHSQRHWAQLATLTRVAGYPTGFRGDLLFSSALR
jgi:uncharacterized damage-inducible protein DinB